MRHLLLLWLALFVIGCGSSVQVPPAVLAPSDPVVSQPPAQNPPPVINPPAEAQTFTLTNLSAATLHNAVKATSTFPDPAVVLQLQADTPIAGQATVVTQTSVGTTVGASLSLQSFPWATNANDGTYTILSVADNAIIGCSKCQYVFACTTCTNYYDEACNAPNESETYDGFPSSATMAGTIYLSYREGWFHTGGCSNNAHRDGRVMLTTSSDGVNWTAPAAIFNPSPGCGPGGAFNCDVRNLILGVASDGSLLGAVNIQDGILNVFISQNFTRCVSNCASASSWSALQSIGVSPDGNQYISGDQIATCSDGNSRQTMWDVSNGKLYVYKTTDHGLTWTNEHRVTDGGSYTTFAGNEWGIWCGQANTLVLVGRAAKCVAADCGSLLLGTSQDGGATWSIHHLPIGLVTGSPGDTWEQVAPILYPVSSGVVSAWFGERENTASVYTLRALSMNVAAILADYTAVGVPQNIWSGSYTDFSYPAVTQIGTNPEAVSIAFYSQIAPTLTLSKMYTMTGNYQGAAAMGMGGGKLSIRGGFR